MALECTEEEVNKMKTWVQHDHEFRLIEDWKRLNANVKKLKGQVKRLKNRMASLKCLSVGQRNDEA